MNDLGLPEWLTNITNARELCGEIGLITCSVLIGIFIFRKHLKKIKWKPKKKETVEETIMRYSDLTPYQKQIICNGCGPKGLFIPVPQFIFFASCNHHDFKYWRGAGFGFKRLARLKADQQFYSKMLDDIEGAPFLKQSKYYLWAYRYFKMVRAFGWMFFNWGNPKNQDDLNKIKKGE